MTSTIDLYYFPPSPPCRIVMMVARAIDLHLNLKMVDLMAGEHMTPEFLKLNPEHTLPTMNDNGFILWESRPTACYMIDAYGKDTDAQDLYPKDIKKRALVDQRLFFDSCTLFARLVDYFGPVLRELIPAPEKSKKERFEEAMEILNNILEHQEWVAVEHMTIADIAIMVTVDTAECVSIEIDKYTHVMKWLENCRKAMGKFGYDEIEATGANMLGQYFKSKLH